MEQLDLTSMLVKVLEPFANASFWGLTLAISVLMTTLVKSLRAASPVWAQGRWVVFVLTWTNVLLGVVGAIPPGFVVGDHFIARLPYGIVAGGMSHYAYRWLLKRFKFFGGDKDKKDGGGGGGDSPSSTGFTMPPG